jgi:hypothetical protein
VRWMWRAGGPSAFEDVARESGQGSNGPMPRPGSCSRSSRPPPELDPFEDDPDESVPDDPDEDELAVAEALAELEDLGELEEPCGLGLVGWPVRGDVLGAATVLGRVVLDGMAYW